MMLAVVKGSVVCTRKNPDMEGVKFLVIQPVDAHGREKGEMLVATDAIGAGAGETVFWCRGREATIPFLPKQVATDACIVGIVDTIHTIRKP
jgi:ethanolamine utilization protein EutN